MIISDFHSLQLDLAIIANMGKIGRYLKFTALPFQNQTMYVNESCQFCSTCALVLETAESSIPCGGVNYTDSIL